MFCISTAFDKSKLSADLKNRPQENFPCCVCSEQQSRQAGLSQLSFLGARLWQRAGVSAVRKGFSAEHGHSCWPCTTPEQMASLADLPSFVCPNLSSWSSLEPPVLVFWQIVFTSFQRDVWVILNWLGGLASIRRPCQRAEMDEKWSLYLQPRQSMRFSLPVSVGCSWDVQGQRVWLQCCCWTQHSPAVRALCQYGKYLGAKGSQSVLDNQRKA